MRRNKQTFVVGHNKQLSPTSFLDRIAADEEDPVETPNLEFIIALCEGRGLNSCVLRYRSQHPPYRGVKRGVLLGKGLGAH
jgi:hypothetical protein